MRWVLEVLVGSFEESIVEAVHLNLGKEVGAEEDTVSVFEEELARGVGLTAKFGCAGTDVDDEVREAIELFGEIGEILTALGTVCAYEGDIRVPCDDGVALFQQFALGDGRVAEAPTGMCGKLFVTLVLRIDGVEEGAGVGGVKHDGKVEGSGVFEDGYKAFIVDAEQVAVGVAEGQAEVFPELDTDRAVLNEARETVVGAL